MRELLLLLIWCVIGGLCLGCASGVEGPSVAAPPHAALAQAPVPGDVGMAAPVVQRKIVYTSRIEIVVESFTAAQQKLTALVDAVQVQGGFLANQELSGVSAINRRGLWTIRVPLAQFDSFVAELEKLGDVQRHSRDAQDVTEAFADLEARLRNKQASEQRLLSHLEKSAALNETLELEREISRVRGEIEQMQGQLNVMKSKTDLATVSVTLIERQVVTPPMAQGPFATKIVRTFRDSCRILYIFCQGVLLVVAALLPWTLVASFLVAPVWLIRKSRLIAARGNAAR
ncbi:DUF4349 domain-containing protein [Schlesneria paludicola]|uniref:DUF4349 domain-containing protein n=1 Tax=Schlesneria paludicola TaxID=360056 RepID=UPI00029B34BE|nr:DUF4349 domain-containing protein [Schlesneria paludicola]